MAHNIIPRELALLAMWRIIRYRSPNGRVVSGINTSSRPERPIHRLAAPLMNKGPVSSDTVHWPQEANQSTKHLCFLLLGAGGSNAATIAYRLVRI